MTTKWTFQTMAERNAQQVTSADVADCAECVVNSTGSRFRAVRAATGATAWAGVCTEQGTWTPTVSGLQNIDDDPAMVFTQCFYERVGSRITGRAYFAGKLSGATTARTCVFLVSVPVDPGEAFGSGHEGYGEILIFNAPLAVGSAGTDFSPPSTYPTADAKTFDCYFNVNDAAGTDFDGVVSMVYDVTDGTE